MFAQRDEERCSISITFIKHQHSTIKVQFVLVILRHRQRIGRTDVKLIGKTRQPSRRLRREPDGEIPVLDREIVYPERFKRQRIALLRNRALFAYRDGVAVAVCGVPETAPKRRRGDAERRCGVIVCDVSQSSGSHR